MSDVTVYRCSVEDCDWSSTEPAGPGNHAKVHRRPYVSCPDCGKRIKGLERHQKFCPWRVKVVAPPPPTPDEKLVKENEVLRDKLRDAVRLKKQYYADAKEVPALKRRIAELERERRHLGIHD